MTFSRNCCRSSLIVDWRNAVCWQGSLQTISIASRHSFSEPDSSYSLAWVPFPFDYMWQIWKTNKINKLPTEQTQRTTTKDNSLCFTTRFVFFFAKESKWSLIYCTKGSFSVEQFCVVCSRGSFVVSIAILGQHFRRDSVYVSAAHSDVSQLCLTAMLQHSRTETNQHVDFYPLFFWVSSAFIIRNLPPAPWHVDKAIVVEESKYLRYLQVWWTSVKQPKGKIRHTTRQQMLIGEFSAAK